MTELPTACCGYEHTCATKNAPVFAVWIKERGGVAVWRSADLSNPSASWSTPAFTEDTKQPYPKPTWQAESTPTVITDPTKIGVSVDEEAKRFHVAVRRGAQGLSFKCTDASSNKIRKEVSKAGDGAYYVFDYYTQEAVIFKSTGWESLADWMKHNEVPA